MAGQSGAGGGGLGADGGTSNGCTTSTVPHVAPGGYYVNGNTICTADGNPHLFHGVARPSLEWSSTGEQISASDFQLQASWDANVSRISLYQDFWLSNSPIADPKYPATVDAAVKWAEEAGMDVILDLHWSDRGTLGSCPTSGFNPNCAQLMADTNSITFWSQVASIYKNDGRVLFELYNEPHDVSWAIWLSGGMTSEGWTAAGMQQLYDAIRAAGADNLVIAGGLEWAYNLAGLPQYRIQGYNIMYAAHPYAAGDIAHSAGGWSSYWGFLAATDPIIMTEFGDTHDCSGSTYTAAVTTYVSQLLAYADQNKISWTAWAWYPSVCAFPSLISDWQGTPTPVGKLVQASLQTYSSDPAPGGKRSP
jgi:aryl-phospho-beta-D-glucosidase BglC (GH1 family)